MRISDWGSDVCSSDLVGFALRYYQDFVKPAKRYRAPGETERKALAGLAARLRQLPPDADGEAIQNEVYAVGKEHGYENLRDWFKALYEILLGQEEGPRMGSFMALYGLEESLALIDSVLQGDSAKASSDRKSVVSGKSVEERVDRGG